MRPYRHCKLCDRKFTKENPFIHSVNGCSICKQVISQYRRDNRIGCVAALTISTMPAKEKRLRRIRVLRMQRKQRAGERLYNMSQAS